MTAWGHTSPRPLEFGGHGSEPSGGTHHPTTEGHDMAGKTSHRFLTEGEGRVKQFRCSCGQWAMTGSAKRVKGIRALFDAHAEKGGLSSATETTPEPENQTGE